MLLFSRTTFAPNALDRPTDPQEIKQGSTDRVRTLLERATSLALPPKKMKFLFRRWLEFEKGHGGEEQVAHVKQRALEFVQQHQD
jgi:rRNA biogenesis protein RRP5